MRRFFATTILAAAMILNGCGGEPPHELARSAPGDAERTSAPTTGYVDGSPLAGSPPDPTLVPSPYGDLFFAEHRGSDFPSARLEGRLIVDEEGCLRLAGMSQGAGETIIWAPWYDLKVEGGEVRVLDPEGKIVATVGDSVVMGGGQVGPKLSGTSGVSERTARALEERCPGLYAFMGEAEQTK